MARVVVVGGGLAGCATAARLAKLGHTVTVCERSDRLGGAIGYVEKDGFCWDAGPATMTLPAVVRDLFRKSGRPLERELELVPVDPARSHRFADGTTLDLPGGSRSRQVEAMGAALGADPARAWAEFVDRLAPVWEVLRTHALERGFAGCEALGRQARRVVRPRRSLRRLANSAFDDARLRALLEHPTVMAGSDPRHTPGFVSVEAFVERTFGRWRPAAGMGALAAALATRLQQRKVDVRLAREVVEIGCRDGEVHQVVLADGTSLPADVVVAAGLEPRSLPRLLAGAEATSLARAARATTPAMPPAVTHLGLSAEAPELPAETVLHGDPTVVVRATDRGPAGYRAWTVLRRGAADEDVLVAMARRGLDVRAQVAVRVDRSPADIVAQSQASPYGVRWSGIATAGWRPSTTTSVRGLYCAGASVHPGPGVPLVGLGAALVAQHVGKA